MSNEKTETIKKHRSTHKPPENLPTTGGSYLRTPDGELVPNPEPAAEPSAAPLEHVDALDAAAADSTSTASKRSARSK